MVKDLVERQDMLEVIMEALMGNIDKLSIKMINRHNVPCRKGKKVKRSTRRALSYLDKCVAKNSNGNEEDDVVNHGTKSYTHQNPLYETGPRRDFMVDFDQWRNIDDHNGLNCNFDSIKLKILVFQGKNDLETYLDWKKECGICI
jgi:hypothetical protein